MHKLLLTLALAGMVGFGSGCTTAAKRVLKEVVGASAKAEAVPPAKATSFARFKSVDIKPARTNLGSLVDAKYSRSLPNQLRKELTRSDNDDPPLFPGGGATLEIEPEITWYSEPGGLGSIMGSDAYAVVLFWMSEGGQPLGRVLTVTSSAAARDDEFALSRATAKGLAKFFEEGRKKVKEKEKDKDDD